MSRKKETEYITSVYDFKHEWVKEVKYFLQREKKSKKILSLSVTLEFKCDYDVLTYRKSYATIDETKSLEELVERLCGLIIAIVSSPKKKEYYELIYRCWNTLFKDKI